MTQGKSSVPAIAACFPLRGVAAEIWGMVLALTGSLCVSLMTWAVAAGLRLACVGIASAAKASSSLCSGDAGGRR